MHDACDECGSTGPRCHEECGHRRGEANDMPACLACGADDNGPLDSRGDCPKCAEARREAEYDG